MLKRLTFLIINILFTAALFGQTSLEGKIIDQVSGEPILFGTVAIYKNGVLDTGTETDLDGNYVFANIDPGTYDVEVSYVGYQTVRVEGVIVKAGQINQNNVGISEGVTMTEIVVVGYKEPLIDFDNTTQGGTITAEEIRALPTRNISAIAATTAGISTGADGEISVRGSREDGTYYYVDGIRVSGDNINNFVSQADIDQLQVITGGIESKYGDVTGGIISITTKGPSDKFSGGMELETSEFLDDYGYNLGIANISGPIFKNKEGKSILGYRLFGQFRRIEDDDPSAIGQYRLSAEKIAELEANPVTSLNGTSVPTAESLTLEDVGEQVSRAPNETDTDYNITGKLDARVSDNVDITLSGSYFDSHNQFTPVNSTSISATTGGRSGNSDGNSRWSLLNWTNNPFYDRNGYRGNFRFRHKIGRQGFASEDEDLGVVRNASYSIQAGYEKSFESTEDVRHGENIFNYGYYGNVSTNQIPTASIVTDTSLWLGQEVQDFDGSVWAHQGYNFEEGEYNPNTEVNLALSQINNLNGTPDGILNSIWGQGNDGLYFNVGRVYNRLYKFEEDRYTLNVDSGFDILPRGSEKGKHNVQFGFMYEQRTQREWTMAPEGLWELARLNANVHINGVDTDKVVGSFEQQLPSGTVGNFTQYGYFTQEDQFQDNLFFKSIRDSQGVPLDQWVFTDELTPDDLTLDMFSAGELNNDPGLGLNYFGFDYLGNRLDSGVTFDDFFTQTDANGRRTFNVAPLQPIYWAGYIQDKFKYKDIIIRLGVRIDAYDANTKVLRDPYSLYDIETAEEFYSRTGQIRPDGVDPNFKVYVTGEESTTVKAFRDGDDWFMPSGTAASGGNVLFGGEIVYPSYSNSPDERNITERGFDPSISFEDYTPELNIMPRAAFSFPITEDAGFFAHYDVLVQRPPSNVGGTALDYFYMEVPGRFGTADLPASNPDLKPEKTVDYEVGFQSKVSSTSAVKISAYYKEMRDMIQLRFYTFLPAPINQYQTFSNLDFGTVKGFAFSYDLRRTGNLQLNTSYTLQFADGSGSDANSSSGLNQRGNIRTLFPLSFDERHAITATIDYRYSSGKQYNGPRIGNTDIFANTGVNFLLRTVSGRPYSQYTTIQQPLSVSGLETINEARLPWFFNVDLRIDKQFKVDFNKESGKGLAFNVYLRVENLLNRKNTLGVYGVTGSPEDDGFIQSTNGQDRLGQIETVGKSVDSFLAAYTWRVANPEFYSRPRRIYLGAMIDF